MGRHDRPTAYELEALADRMEEKTGERHAFAVNTTDPRKFYLQAIRINGGGYDAGGAYWGERRRGETLYRAVSDSGVEVVRYIDAADRDDAKRIIRKEFPLATFYR